MGRKYLNTLVPVRFLCTLAHLICVWLLTYTKDANITSSLSLDYTQQQWNTIDTSINWAAGLHFTCFTIELLGLLTGISLFKPAIHTFDIFAHFCGALILSWTIINSWHYNYIWIVWGFFSLIPALLEIVVFASVGCFKVSEY